MYSLTCVDRADGWAIAATLWVIQADATSILHASLRLLIMAVQY